jgi:8-amino-7-oxononanoate synthase
VSLDDDVQQELARLEREHRLRTPRVVDSMQGPRIVLDGRDVLNFASNDYLSLAGDVRLTRAASTAVHDAGTSVGASRLVVGNHRAHVRAEAALADWLRCPGVRLFGSGYAANLGVLTTLLRPGDIVFSDELNHASIIDGCRLSRAEISVYPHLDVAALERQLQSRRGVRRLVVSETLFSMDGDIADVERLDALCRKHDAALVLDEAHAVGAWGPEGRGVAAAAGVFPDVLVGTCGKALGGYGAFVATSKPVAELLWTRARPFVFSTGLPPHVSAVLISALEIVRSTDGAARRSKLATNTRLLRAALPGAGGHADSAIAPIRIDDDRRVMEITAQLLDHGIYIQGIRPPTVPEGTARLRVSVSSGHSPDEIARAAAAVGESCGPASQSSSA